MIGNVISGRPHNGRVRTLVCSLAISSLLLASATAHAQTPVHQYLFNDGTANDSIGSAHGTLERGASVSGGAVHFAGGTSATGAYVDLPAGDIAINAFSETTLELWLTQSAVENNLFRMDGAFGRHGNPDVGENAGFGYQYIMLQPSRGPADQGSRGAIATDHDLAIDGDAPFADESGVTDGDRDLAGEGLSYMAVTIDATELRYYVDGQQVGSAPLTFDPGSGVRSNSLADVSDAVAYLGRSVYDFDDTMTGSIHQFSIYDVALSDSQILANFNAGTIGPRGPTLEINRDTGAISLLNELEPVNIVGYSITSAAGGLDQSGWTPVSGNFDAAGDGSFDPNSTWTVLSAADNSTDLSEFDFGGGNGGTLGEDALVALELSTGGAWRKSIYEDLQIEAILEDGSTLPVTVRFVGNNGQPFAVGDLTFDGEIGPQDWEIFRANALTDVSGLSLVEGYVRGDLNGDGRIDVSDFRMFKNAFIAAQGAEAFAALGAGFPVPEPATTGMGLMGLALLALARRSRSGATRSVTRPAARQRLAACCAAALLAALTGSSAAQANLTHQYTFNDGTANDAVGGAHGLLNGAATITPFGVLNLPGGEGDFVSLPGPTIGINNYSAATFEAWFTVNAVAAWQRIFDFGDTNPDTTFGLNTVFFTPTSGFGDFRAAISNTDPGFDNEAIASGTPSLPTGAEHHIAVTLDASAISLYHNGSLVSSTPYTDSTGFAANGAPSIDQLSNALAYLGRAVYSDPFLNGTITEFRIYDSALSEQEISDNAYFGPTPADVLGIEVDTVTGNVTLRNNFSQPMTFDYYEIVSRDGALDPSWSGLGSLDSVGSEPGESWDRAGGADQFELAEFFLAGSSTFSPGQTASIGTAFDPSVFGAGNDGDLVFRFALESTGQILSGPVTYVTDVTLPGDFNGDGVVDAADYTVWRDGGGTLAEYQTWKTNFGAAAASGAVVSGSPVPEPTSLASLTIAIVCWLGGAAVRRRR